MSSPVFKTLGTLRDSLRSRLGYGNMGSASGALQGNLDSILQLSQYQLYWMFDWRYLLKTFDQLTGVDQRFYALPSDLDAMQVQSVVSEEMDGIGENHVVNHDFHHNLLGWTDESTGTGSVAFNGGVAQLINVDGANIGILDQQLSDLDILDDYTISFDVVDLGGPFTSGMNVAMGEVDQVPSTFNHMALGIGSHSFDFTNEVANPFIWFSPNNDGTAQTIGVDNIKVQKKSSGSSDGKIWPMTPGIDWQHDNYSNTNGRPLRYEFRDQVEIWPPSDDTKYVIRYEYLKKLGDFSTDDDRATIDDNVLFMHALATAKGHYGQKDFNIVLAQANLLINNIRGKNHGNRRYVRRNPHADRYRLREDDDYCDLVHKNVLDL